MRKYGARLRGLCPTCGRNVALSAVFLRDRWQGEQGQARQHYAAADAAAGTFWEALGRRYCKGGLARPLREEAPR